ncbi:LPS export ABC transporter ATP-binding protein [Prochlorothrix hollandica]|uniref:ABC transporter n=1 Tax=Prochlorothrix hollandica PCC 9006 = CALU 1027 TaxID=317619 RepID=A0A0M2PVS0_PROHO|nr:LPS export ABC transporter ATP-binding protein [Prochlorothrix hollandica]KKJ00260.1 ABC transporter [Prochlorothrix hollandica PCC 9006 = CALU 1027]
MLKIVLENIQKSYGRRTVVKHVNLWVEQGEVVGLLGPNGAGKTTTFYIATGLERPDVGRILLNEVDITHMPMTQRARLGIGYLAQEPSIFRNLTVLDNLRLVLQQSQLSPDEQHDRLQELIGEFNLGAVAQTLGIQVSGGERRRTEIARALASGPRGPQFLLLDEPFAGIDPIAVADLQIIISQLRDKQMGLLITDHNVRETLTITDRAYILRDGEILASGTPTELYNNPLVRAYYLGENFRL